MRGVLAPETLRLFSCFARDHADDALWNPTDQAKDLTFTFYYGDGSGSYVLPVHLAANGSTMIDVVMLIESGQPDANGLTFSMTETAGWRTWRCLKAEADPSASGRSKDS